MSATAELAIEANEPIGDDWTLFKLGGGPQDLPAPGATIEVAPYGGPERIRLVNIAGQAVLSAFCERHDLRQCYWREVESSADEPWSATSETVSADLRAADTIPPPAKPAYVPEKLDGLVIGVHGLAGSGKDTFAEMLTESSGVVRVALADPLKRYAKDLWGFNDEQLWGPSEARNAVDDRVGVSPREVLQRMGTEGVRDSDPNAWIRKLFETAAELFTPAPAYSPQAGAHRKPVVHAVVVPDVRFENELQAIRAAGGVVVRVKREGAGLEGDAANHLSERQLENMPDEDFDAVIVNNGTLAELRVKAERLLAGGFGESGDVPAALHPRPDEVPDGATFEVYPEYSIYQRTAGESVYVTVYVDVDPYKHWIWDYGDELDDGYWENRRGRGIDLELLFARCRELYDETRTEGEG